MITGSCIVSLMQIEPATEHRQLLLVREVQNANRRIFNNLDTRKHHPTYGITKTMVRDAWRELWTLAAAYDIVYGTDGVASQAMCAQRTFNLLGIDIEATRAAVQAGGVKL